MTNYVYSTLTSDVNYTSFRYHGQRKDMAVPERSVLIKGGANVVSDRKIITKDFTIHEGETPAGAITSVTDEELEFLEANPVFRMHQENGYIKVDKKKMDVEKGVKGLKSGDDSQPKTPQNLPNFRAKK